jgi:putative flippase GtrA
MTPAQEHLIGVLKFGAVGVLGFLVDASVLYLAWSGIGLDLYSSRVLSYICAATTTWWLNRSWTFRSTDQRHWAEWLRFVALNLGGGVVNYTAYALLVTLSPLFGRYPVLAVAVGSLSGMLVNYAVSYLWVFRNTNMGGSSADAS